MGREEGGGFRMGNTCMPVADSFRYTAEPISIVKFKNKIKKKRFLEGSGKQLVLRWGTGQERKIFPVWLVC